MSQTHHIDRPDGSRIAYTLEGPAQAPAVVLSNSFGLGGQNASAIFRRYRP